MDSHVKSPNMEPGGALQKLCIVCQAPADKQCSGCHIIDYCCVEHQKLHWKTHKKNCTPIRIATSPEFGRHFVATRDLPPGTLVLTELPVIVKPYVKSEDDPPMQSCLSCRSTILSNEHRMPCFKCSTPFFCNLNCAMNKIHSETECEVISKLTILKNKIKVVGIAPYLAYIRAIRLKNKDPATWDKIMGMKGADRYKPGKPSGIDKWFIKEILPHFGEKGLDFAKSEMFKLKGILEVNFINDESKQSLDNKEAHGRTQFLYCKASNLTKSCFPNCFSIIGKGPNFKLEIWTALEIKKGQVLTLDYTRREDLTGAVYRQHIERNEVRGGVLCTCPRCRDPSELGTMLSAVKCTQSDCRDGYILPVDPMDMGMEALWRCNRTGCDGKGNWREIFELTKELKRQIHPFSKPEGLEKRMDPFVIYGFLNKLRTTLHPNHWLVLHFEKVTSLTFARLLVLSGLLFGTPECGIPNFSILSLPIIELDIWMLEDQLRMAEFTSPGLTLTRAKLLDKLIFALLAKGVRLESSTPNELHNDFKERAIWAADQWIPIAKFYPGFWDEGEMQKIKKMKAIFERDLIQI